jgi:hypothetical protein
VADKPLSKMNKAELEKLAKKEKVNVPEDASKADLYDALKADREADAPTALTDPGDSDEAPAPDSVVPPSSGPDDVMSSSMFDGKPGSVDPETGKTVPYEQPYTGERVAPAETLVDGGPEPPQPRGGDEPEKPLEQTAAPGFKTEGDVAAAKAEAAAGRKAARQRQRETRVREQPQPGIAVSEPRAQHTLLTITGRHFPPGKPVKVHLSASRTPSGLTTLRADPDGTVQLSIYPDPGEQSVTFEGDGVSASADFTVASQG